MAHIDADWLELYALGRLKETEIAPLEMHLLVCHQCQNALGQTDREIAILKRELKRELEANRQLQAQSDTSSACDRANIPIIKG